MRNIIFAEEQDSYPIAILIKPSNFKYEELKQYYMCLDPKLFIAFPLEYFDGKVRTKEAREWLKELNQELDLYNVKYLYIADAAYFKLITKQTRAEVNLGYVFDVGNRKATLGINYGSLLYDPHNAQRLKMSLDTLKEMYHDSISTLGSDVIHSSIQMGADTDIQSLRNCFTSLHNHHTLAVDIETQSLDFIKAGIHTIGFAWDEHNGIAINLQNQEEKKALLKEFLLNYKGKLIFHNASYDMKVLIYELFMKDITDIEGLIKALETLNWEDTKLLAYMALNSTASISYSLKTLCHEFAGNYAVEVEDISKLKEEDLLRYNLIDCLCTFYLYKKYPPENPELYKLLKDTQKALLQMEIVGVPIDINQVKLVQQELEQEKVRLKTVINSYPEVEYALEIIKLKMMNKKNVTLKRTKKTIEDYASVGFNLNSSDHLRVLLYEVLKLPIQSFTDGGKAATDGDTLNKLLQIADKDYLPLLDALVEYSKVEKILTSFIPHLLNADETPEGYRLHGNFNIGGTKSGRLSSSKPNLQNLPSGSKWGKAIKECFVSDKKILVGADFNALEDRINALLTKDPNKRAVFTQGYDGHSMRAAYYYNIPDTNPVPEGTRCYKMGDLYFTGEEKLLYQGQIYTGDELYEICKRLT